MAQLQERAALLSNEDVLDEGIRAVTSYSITGGTVIVSATGIGGGLVSYFLADSGAVSLLDTAFFYGGNFDAAHGSMRLEVINDGATILVGGLGAGTLYSYGLRADGQITNRTELDVVGTGSYGAVTETDSGLIITADQQGTGVLTYSQNGTESLTLRNIENDTNVGHARTVVDVETVTLASGIEVLITASQSEQGISSYRLNGFDPAFISSVGPDSGVGIMVPTDVEVLTMNGQAYVIVASAPGSGSSGALSVMRVSATGALSVTDHLLDDLNSRFGGVQAIDVIEVGGRWYVAAGGGDDGISLFSVMPGGTLMLVDTIADSVTMGLSDVSGLTLAEAGGNINVFVASNADVGLTHLTFDLGGQGVTLQAASAGADLMGTAGADILVGQSGVDRLDGAGGDDTLMDGAGQDRLTGGTGADTFVFSFDGARDVITDFNQNVDQIDLSFWPFLYDVDALQITQLSNGVRISHQGEILDVQGAGLTPEGVRATIVEGPARANPAIYEGGSDDPGGNTGNDTGGTGEDTGSGGTGEDTLYGGGSGDADLLVGTGLSDTLIGYQGDDTIRGDDEADLLVGGMDNDLIYGGGGNDNIRGGEDQDTIFGEAGNDFIQGGNGDDRIVGGGGDNKMFGQRGEDSLYGGSQRDTLNSGGGSDFLSGGGGNDWFRAGNSNDTLWGGDGRDTLFGNSEDDILIGGAGNDRLNAGGGEDTLEGGTGDDYLKGGGGADTFKFSLNMGSDQILSYDRTADILEFDSSLLNGQTTGAEVLAAYGSVVGKDVVFDFGGGDVLTLLWSNRLDGIVDDILIV